MLSYFLSSESFIVKSAKSITPLVLLLLFLGPASGLLAAYLLVKGYWQIALLLVALLPGLLLLHRYPFTTVCIWLVLAPFLLHTNTAPERWVYWVIHRGLPPLSLGILLLGSGLRISSRPVPRLNPADLCMLAYVAVSLVGIFLQNGDPLGTSYQFYDRVIAPVCLYWIIRLSYVNEKQLKWLIPVAFFISISQSFFGILSWYNPNVLPSDWLTMEGSPTIGSLVNPSVFTVALVFSGLLVLHAALTSRSRLVRWVLVFAFLLSAYSVFVSFSRASWLAAIIVALGLVHIYPKFVLKGSLLLLPVILVLGGWAFSSQVRYATQRLYSADSERSALSRLPLVVAAYRMFQLKPVFGWGYGNFDLYDRSFQGRIADFIGDNKDHASHNLYLTLLAEQGIVGIALFMGPFVWWLVKSLKIQRDLPRFGFWGRKLLIILWLSILTHVVVNNFANMRVVYGLGLWWIALALVANLVSITASPARRMKIPKEFYPQETSAVWTSVRNQS
jgi:O-antigen ligase